MDFLGIGPMEIVLILVIAFIFLGPEKLPGIAAKMGRLYHNLTKTTNEITNTLNKEIALEKEQKEEIDKPQLPQENADNKGE